MKAVKKVVRGGKNAKRSKGLQKPFWHRFAGRGSIDRARLGVVIGTVALGGLIGAVVFLGQFEAADATTRHHHDGLYTVATAPVPVAEPVVMPSPVEARPEAAPVAMPAAVAPRPESVNPIIAPTQPQKLTRHQARALRHAARRHGRSVRAEGTESMASSDPASTGSVSSFGGGSLVSTARQYLGTNPTGRGSLWCGAFMDMVLKQTGHRGGGNLARAYANYGTRISGPQVGAIVVLGRKGGGHVGVVSGIDANGNPIVISGNHNRRVAESTYPRSRVIAYVMPN